MADTKSYTYRGPGKHLHFDEESKSHKQLKPGDKVELTDEQAVALADRFEVDRSMLGGTEDGHAIRSTEPGTASRGVMETVQEREELAKVEREAEEARAEVFDRDAKARSGQERDPEPEPEPEPKPEPPKPEPKPAPSGPAVGGKK